jgi:hypothetical protein
MSPRRRPKSIALLRLIASSWAAVALLAAAIPAITAGIILTSSAPASASATCPYQVLQGHANGAVTLLGPSGDSCSDVFHGSMAGQPLNKPIVGMAATPDGGGYWLVASDGGIFSFGDAQFYGSMGNKPLNAPVVGMASTPDGKGYWLVAADGGVFNFGDAQFHGSMGGIHLVKPVVGIAADGSTGGYWEVAADGGIFSFDAPFFGSMGGKTLNAPIQFVTGTPDFGGYRMVGSDGGVFNFGDAQFYGSAASPGGTGWEALTSTPDGAGYWLFSATASDPFGDAAKALVQVSGDTSTDTIVGAATLNLGTGSTPPTTPSPPGSSSSPPAGSLNAVACPSASLCVAVGGTTSDGIVEISDNAGASLTSATVPTGTPSLDGVTCPDVTHCFAVGSSTILSSNDGGSTWAATSGGQNLTGVSCRTDVSCAAVGSLGSSGTSFIYTTNGTSWATSDTPTGANAMGVSCTTSICVAAGETPYVSDDGGGTWQSETVGGGIDGLFSVSCIAGTKICVAVGPNPAGLSGPATGQLVVSTDNGSTWTNEDSNMGLGTATAREISCTASTYCGVAGLPVNNSQTDQFGPTLFAATDDSGATWAAPTGPSGFTDPTYDLGISCWAASNCVIVGGKGSAVSAQVTNNDGSSWTASTY